MCSMRTSKPPLGRKDCAYTIIFDMVIIRVEYEQRCMSMTVYTIYMLVEAQVMTACVYMR